MPSADWLTNEIAMVERAESELVIPKRTGHIPGESQRWAWCLPGAWAFPTPLPTACRCGPASSPPGGADLSPSTPSVLSGFSSQAPQIQPRNNSPRARNEQSKALPPRLPSWASLGSADPPSCPQIKPLNVEGPGGGEPGVR